jgi:hypothetical protein
MSSKCADLRRPVAGGHSRTPFGYLGVKLSIPTVDGGRGADAVSTAHRRDLFWGSTQPNVVVGLVVVLVGDVAR